ncbi:hypothetical protein H4R33_005525 [Dimargaris cristalligena]|nr:hypothetical protein H4R33_005525 [Dimargaris cristalligena]
MESRETIQAWRQIIRQQLLGSIFYSAYSKWSSTSHSLRGMSDYVRTVSQSTTLRYYQYLKTNQDHPLFQKEVWRFVSPDRLPVSVLRNRLPLLALIDDQPDGSHIVTLIRALTDPSLLSMGLQGWTPSELGWVMGLIRGERITPEGDGIALRKLHGRLFKNIVVLAMTRLSTTHRFTVLMEFLVEIKKIDALWDTIYGYKCDYLAMLRLALLLAAVAQEPGHMASLSRLVDRELVGLSPFLVRDSQCRLVSFMRTTGLPRGANALRQLWNCTPDDRVVWDYLQLPLMEQLYLTNTNQMGVSVLATAFKPGEITAEADLGRWVVQPANTATWAPRRLDSTIFWRDLEPDYLADLQQMAHFSPNPQPYTAPLAPLA